MEEEEVEDRKLIEVVAFKRPGSASVRSQVFGVLGIILEDFEIYIIFFTSLPL